MNYPSDTVWQIIGYPSESPFDPGTMYTETCVNYVPNSEGGTSAAFCDFNEGASGGPWLGVLAPLPQGGYVNGVSSNLIDTAVSNQPYELHSPYFDTRVEDLLNFINSIPVT